MLFSVRGLACFFETSWAANPVEMSRALVMHCCREMVELK
jgi:hypothetical protein